MHLNRATLLTVLGFVAYVAAWVLVDSLLHRASWSGGQAFHHLRAILPEILWSALFAFLLRLGIRLRRDARS